MSVWHGNGEYPKRGAKIEYALSHNKIEVAIYGDLARLDAGEGIGLSDGTPWRYVLMWKYEDEDYNYGEGSKKNVSSV